MSADLSKYKFTVDFGLGPDKSAAAIGRMDAGGEVVVELEMVPAEAASFSRWARQWLLGEGMPRTTERQARLYVTAIRRIQRQASAGVLLVVARMARDDRRAGRGPRPLAWLVEREGEIRR